MDGYNFILDAAVIFYGCRVGYVWFQMRRAKSIVDSKLICPRDAHPADCKDPSACYRFLQKRLIIFSVLAIIGGIFNIVCTFFPVPHSAVFLTVSTICIVLSVVFFCYTISYSAKRYW